MINMLIETHNKNEFILYKYEQNILMFLELKNENGQSESILKQKKIPKLQSNTAQTGKFKTMIDRNCNIGKIRKNVPTSNVQHQNLLKPSQQNKNQVYAQKQSLQQSSYLTKSKMVNNMALSMFSSFAFQNQSLRKYRQKFLGNLSSIQQNARPDFELHEIRIVPKKQTNTGALVRFSTILENGNEKLFKPKEIIQHIILLQGTLYNFIMNFEVSKEILYGVRLINSTYKFGIKMDQKQYKIGSFAPGVHKRSIDVKTPSGFLKRGQYKCQLKIYDQYDECYGTCTYSILIAGK